MQHASTLVVLTLLQLCRAEIPEPLPEWYAANLINDAGFQPKPLTEIFTTQASFSSKNPIIVTSTASSTNSEEMFSTSSTGRGPTTPSSPTDSRPSTEDTTRRVIPLQENRPQILQAAQAPQTPLTPLTSQTSQPPDIPRQMYQAPPQIQVLVAQVPPQIQQQQQQYPPSPQNPPMPQMPPSPQMPQLPPLPPVPQTPSPPQIQVQPLNQQQQTTGQPNYFLIYQQAPLSIQQYPQSAAQSVSSSPVTQTTTETDRTQEATRSTTVPSLSSQPSTEISSTELTTQMSTTRRTTTQISTTDSPTTQTTTQVIAHRNIRQGAFGFSSTITPFGTTWLDPSTAPEIPYSNPPISSTIPPNVSNIPCLNASTVRNPTTNLVGPAQAPNGNRVTGLTIRVSAPRGSITNIKINPSTTTKKPSTRRPPRRKGNNYNNCVESCKGRKEPLCATPLAIVPIDPNTLKGFPSICHLACHNSFRNQPYEKVIDGRCSKLRTRIRTFDKNKLKREELEKSQYTVLNNVPETIVQVIQNDRSGRF